MEPYHKLLHVQHLEHERMTGAKLTGDLIFRNGLEACVWHNEGYVGRKGCDRSFRQIGLDIVSPTFLKPLLLESKNAEWRRGYYEVLGKLRVAAMK
jgi:hypothetical protein